MDLALAFLVGSMGLAFTWFYFDHGLDPFDHGLFATAAWQAGSGGVYGTDFLAPYGPGRYYLIALLFELFGASLKTQAYLWLALRAAVPVLVFLAARRFLSRVPAVLPALVVIMAPGALHKGLFQAVAVSNVLVYLVYRKRRTGTMCFIAGIVMGVGTLFRVDAGVFGCVSFLALIGLELLWDCPRPPFKTVLRRCSAFVGGAAVPTLPVLIYLFLVSDVGLILTAEWHRVLNVSSFAEYLPVPDLIGSGMSASLPAFKRFLLALMLRAAPAVYLLLAAAAVFKRVRKSSCVNSTLEILSLPVFGILVLNQVRITPTFNHLLHAAPLVFVSAVVLAHMFIGSRFFAKVAAPDVLKTTAASLLCLLPCALPVYYNLALSRGVLPGSIRNRFDFTEPLELDRAGIFVGAQQARELEDIVHYIEANTSPEDTLFAGPFEPVINFLSGRPPAVGFLEPFYYFGSERLQREVIRDLERSKPPVVVIDQAIVVGRMSLEKDAPLIHAFLRQSYTQAGMPGKERGPYRILLRREQPSPGFKAP